jgi:hypothetical protein
MHPLLIFVALAVNALPITEVLRAQGSVDYFDPRERGGSLLDNSAGLGEPLNVIALLRNQSIFHPVYIKRSSSQEKALRNSSLPVASWTMLRLLACDYYLFS